MTNIAGTYRGRLDCGTPESSLASFCEIVGLSSEELRHQFEAFDLETFYQTEPLGPPADEVVFRNVLNTREQRCQPGDIRWFHATRALPGTDFTSQGIRPTSEIVDHLWALLRKVDPDPPTDVEWASFRSAVEEDRIGHWSNLYGLKVRHQSGPFAFLIREELFHFGETHSVNYFRSPETVEDICLCYEEMFKRPLLPAFLRQTRPCIVSFIDSRPSRVMDTVALYLYRHHKREAAFRENTCFDGGGIAIRPDQISGVEWPDVSTDRRDG